MIDLRPRLQAALGDAYRVEKELGGGGMSRVFVARDVELGRAVVVKVLPPEMAAGVNADRFQREIQLAASLQHPHIVPLLSAGRRDDLVWYTMPLIEGEPLRAKLAREGELPVPETIRLLRDVADALAYAHAHGVVHRDIKPDNVLITGHHAVVTDFGVAKALSAATGEASLTSIGVALGTPAYMAPEQAAADPHVDHRADIYALGAMAYEMLTSAPPFGGNAQAVLAAHLTQAPTAVTERRAAVPPGLAALVMRCLAKKPADRWQSAAELHQQLEAMATPSGGTIPVTPVGPVNPRRRPVLLIGALVALAIVASVLISRRHGPKVDPRAASLAVAPFGHASTDTALDRLGRDLVVTLSANLDGVGDIRTVDALTVLAQAPKGSQALTLEDARALALRYRAASVVYGTLVRNGPGVRLDFGVYTSDSGRVVARASVSGAPDSVQVLTDSATWALLHEVWRGGRAPAPSLDAVTTKSVPALRAFLQGEDLILAGRFTEAGEAFGRAMAADSTFWWAYRRYVYALSWYGKPVDPAIRAAYVAHRAELPERERLLIEAGLTGGGDTSATAFLDNLRRVTQRFPDYWPGWFDYGDYLYHYGPLIGGTHEDAIAVLQRTLELNPRLAPAWQHLEWAAGERDPALAAAAIDSEASLGYGAASLAEWGFDPTRFALAYYRTGRVDQRLFDSVAIQIASAPTSPMARWFPYLFASGVSAGGPAVQIGLSRRLLATRPSGVEARNFQVCIAEDWAAAGAWDSAMAVLKTLAAMDPNGDRALDGYRLTVVGAWLGAVEPAMARAHRAPAAAVVRGRNRSERGELLWLDGLLAYTRGDRTGLAAARAALAGLDTGTVPLLQRSLAGFEAALGNTADGGRILARLEWERPELGEDGYHAYPYLVAVDRLAAARWLLAAGDTTQATRLLTWSDGGYPNLGFLRGLVVGGTESFLERARIAEARGQKELAAQHYRSFLRRFVLPDARVKHLRDEAEAALARLEGRAVGEAQRDP